MVHFYIRSVINLFLLLFLSGIFTASAFGGDEKNSTNALEVYGQAHVGAISQVENDQGYASKEEVTTGKWQVATPPTLDQKILLAEKENQCLKKQLLCVRCKVNERSCLYLPCAHIVACTECEDKEEACVSCKKNIEALKTVLLPRSMMRPYNNTAPSNRTTEEAAPSQSPTNPSPQNHETYTPTPTPTPQQNASVATFSQQSLPSNNTGATNGKDFGLITRKPKCPEYVEEEAREKSFEEWPSDHHLKPHDLVRAGFSYTGNDDCVRCFYCGGRLTKWKEGGDVWVGHARWFPKCPFVLQKMGKSFIDAVQELVQKRGKNHGIISYEQVMDTMRKNGDQVPHRPGKDPEPLDIYQKILIDQGFREVDVREATQRVKDKGKAETLDAIYEELVAIKAEKITQSGTSDKNINCSVRKKNETQERKQEILEYLKKKNDELKQRTLCEECLEKKVDIVFLPCGHFSCLDCSYYLETCHVCEDNIKGRVKAEIPY